MSLFISGDQFIKHLIAVAQSAGIYEKVKQTFSTGVGWEGAGGESGGAGERGREVMTE